MSFDAAIKAFVMYVIGALLFLAFIIVTIVKADSPQRILIKWLFTFPVLAVMVLVVAPLVGKGGYGAAFGGMPMAAVCGLLLAIIWFQEVAALVASPIASLYDGGNVPPEAKPAYSVAMARQKNGHYQEAAEEVRKQLERFPRDVEGHLLLATIQAESLGDIRGAEETIAHFISQPGHAPKNLVFALYSLADWQLAIAKDMEAAERALRKVQELLPDTEFSAGAAQRIAHLPTAAEILGSGEAKKYFVREGIRNVGLLPSALPEAAPVEPPEVLAQKYVRHLEQHPQDLEVREQLAVIYLDHYGRLDLATMELEDVINDPQQTVRAKAHCLNRLADLQLRAGANHETIKATLARIIELDPKVAAAETARRRIDMLRLEMKAKSAKDPVKMGEYEQNIGLKHGRGAGYDE